MRAVIQRVSAASIRIGGQLTASINCGILVFLGVEHADEESDAVWLAGKIARMRLHSDPAGQMNLSVTESGGAAMVVSQFTLHAATKKGNRPSFIRAARPEMAEPLYEKFCAMLAHELGAPVARGVFGADMQVSLVNDGPVTILMDSKLRE